MLRYAITPLRFILTYFDAAHYWLSLFINIIDIFVIMLIFSHYFRFAIIFIDISIRYDYAAAADD